MKITIGTTTKGGRTGINIYNHTTQDKTSFSDIMGYLENPEHDVEFVYKNQMAMTIFTTSLTKRLLAAQGKGVCISCKQVKPRMKSGFRTTTARSFRYVNERGNLWNGRKCHECQNRDLRDRYHKYKK